jgi:hypothetical protein
MHGPRILAATLSHPTIDDKFGNTWQYHSRSDRHSKIACWGIAFDLLIHSATLRRHASDEKIVFGLNHEMRDFATGREKRLDLVIARPSSTERGVTFASLADQYGLALTPDEKADLASLPTLREGAVGAVLIALEAKACMTEHTKALPRLYDELNSSHLTVHGASESALAIAFVMVNASAEFLSSDRNRFDLAANAPAVSRHEQPVSTIKVRTKIGEIPRRTRTGQHGFDGIGVVVVSARNDGSPVELLERSPAPLAGDLFHYDAMIARMANEYDVRFRDI